MAPHPPTRFTDPQDSDDPCAVSEQDLWFLPAPPDDDDDPAPFLPGPQRGDAGAGPLGDWLAAQAGQAAELARVAARLGALDDRLRRGPAGWRHRLALIEAADLSWVAGDRVGPDRLAQWIAQHLSGAQADTAALARAGWAVRRLGGGPGPEAGLAAFLDRRDAGQPDDPLAERAAAWLGLMEDARALHPIARACMGLNTWALAGLGREGELIEAHVTAARLAAADCAGAVFAPLAMGASAPLPRRGAPAERLSLWLDRMERATVTAMRHLDDTEAWADRAGALMSALSGRTPPALRAVFCEWPLVSAPMAEALTGASRAAVQRNLAWMEAQGLIREVTGQGRFRMWRLSK